MEGTLIVMWVGFFLAAYSVVGNDVIQTLGTFLTSNEKTKPWYVLWGFASIILILSLVVGYYDLLGNADKYPIAYGRLDKYDMPEIYHWYYLLPPLVLLLITRSGIPISTTFMILTLFSLQKIPNEIGEMTASVFDTDAKLGGMIFKSLMGYLIAFATAIVVYISITGFAAKKFVNNPLSEGNHRIWVVLQWLSTGFLWFQWLTQDLANIYIYLKGGENMGFFEFFISVLILVGLLGYIFYRKGGAVQNVVRVKYNTADIRSATIIDFIYGLVLYTFKYDYFNIWGAKLPMSTTWIFVGLLAGREIGIRLHLDKKLTKATSKMVLSDLAKVFFGLVVSVALVFIIKLLSSN